MTFEVGEAAHVVSVAVAVWAAVSAHRSAGSGARSAEQAKRAADEAAGMREIEADRRAEEKERRHEALAPALPGEIEVEFRENPRLAGGHGSLFGKITLPRRYRVKAEAVRGQSRTELSLGVVTPGREIDFQIEQWHPEQVRPQTEEIVFRFWPPMAVVGQVLAWACGCGRPMRQAMAGPGHWEQRVKVSYYRIEDSVH